ncbi:hypothetical protein Focb16_v011086 [Fusarium oxysporum f. sp. cubense]|uniref:Uncharacterized protein n=1 Tax=Fusarium oxysporum f. sp. cubense TaxID=61366 RepID=A0A559L1P3_FUSOC|nr:hypothetical protein Focb16_v011086 [Fusarium oxysporum f. sp. cubense]
MKAEPSSPEVDQVETPESLQSPSLYDIPLVFSAQVPPQAKSDELADSPIEDEASPVVPRPDRSQLFIWNFKRAEFYSSLQDSQWAKYASRTTGRLLAIFNALLNWDNIRDLTFKEKGLSSR